MIKMSVLVLVLIFSVYSLNASVEKSNFFKLSAGTKSIYFPSNTGIEWSDFCIGQLMGCARFKLLPLAKLAKTEVKPISTTPQMGFLKVVSDKIERKYFEKYCQEVFKLSKASDQNLKKFVNNSDSKLLHYWWLGANDETHFFWKNGLTLMVTTSSKFNLNKIIREASLNEKL